MPPHLRASAAIPWLVPEFDDGYAFARYPSWEMGDPGFYVPAVLLVIASATVGAVVPVLVPPAWVCRQLRGVPGGQRNAPGLIWRAMLIRSPAPWKAWILVAVVGGIGVAFLGDAWAMICGHIAQEQAWARGAPASVTFIEPFLGVLALPDSILMAAWATLAPAVLILSATHGRFMAREARIDRRCLECGYPRARPTAMEDPTGRIVAARCSECGKKIGVNPAMRRRVVFRSAAILSVFAVAAVLAFIAAPYFAGN